MKKLLIVLGILVIALTVGYAYAAEKDMSVDNGITVVAESPLTAKLEGPGLAIENGITVFGTPPESTLAYEHGASGSAAGGMSEEGARMEFHNGITDFKGGPEAN